MDATLVIAIVGAITGTVSVSAQLFSAARDRPRILLSFGSVDRLGQKPSIWLQVTNAGHRATTLREVGFYAKEANVEIGRGGEPYGYAKGAIQFPFAHGVFLEPGQARELEQRPDMLSFHLHADFPLRVYAVDIRGRRIWGNAGPLLRMMVGDAAALPDDAPEEFKQALAPSDEPMYPAQVEPRWKLWKRKELRLPETWKG